MFLCNQPQLAMTINQGTNASSRREQIITKYVWQIHDKIQQNTFVPSDIFGNPQGIFKVTLLPNGDVLSVKLMKSGGIACYDEAVKQAILKSSPLPVPHGSEVSKIFE